MHACEIYHSILLYKGKSLKDSTFFKKNIVLTGVVVTIVLEKIIIMLITIWKEKQNIYLWNFEG